MTHKFRKKIPKRRDKKNIVKRYQEHKDDLIVDFRNRCGYCGAPDKWRTSWYEIDHFVPKDYIKIATDLDEQTYKNLVYACRSCNNAKRSKWPTERPDVHNDGNKGFVDPCEVEYDSYFFRDENGSIFPHESDLAMWMYNAFKFYKPRHHILWQIEEASDDIDTIQSLLKDEDLKELMNKNPDIFIKLLDLYKKYKKYTEDLASYK